MYTTILAEKNLIKVHRNQSHKAVQLALAYQLFLSMPADQLALQRVLQGRHSGQIIAATTPGLKFGMKDGTLLDQMNTTQVD